MCCLLLTLSFGGCVVCTVETVFWWMCCLYFWPCLLVDVLSVLLTLSFGGCVFLYFWPCLLMDLLSVLLPLSFGGCVYVLPAIQRFALFRSH
jgi:hypothetical protein